uniref:Ribosomal protein S11 n=1 Tax=Gracilariopsis longissima TaxID=172976 RepID=A0A345UBJ4_9FLOR|nr:ribosomal protein S11 [Gracilariopsis longissima]AXI97830.1 ribosomal protein S11 [Gracilariopsis longissima]UAD89932.1 ribosomal protein S11 [Gracilariopsis longissima]
MLKNNLKSVILVIIFTSNNILYTLTNTEGKVLFWTSAGLRRTKGTKKITLTTIASSIKIILAYLNNFKIKNIHLKFKGLDKNKKIVLKYMKQSTLNILSITNNSMLPHNGCKRTKLRRI